MTKPRFKNFEITFPEERLVDQKELEERKTQLLQKYKAKNLVDAHLRATVLVENQENLDDIADLEDYFHVLEGQSQGQLDKITKVAFKMCMTTIKSQKNVDIIVHKLLNFKNRLMHGSVSSGVISELIKEFSERKQNSGNIKEYSVYFYFLNLVECILSYKEINCNLKEKFEQIPKYTPYAQEPILLCEHHDNKNAMAFYEKFFTMLKSKGYQAVGSEASGKNSDEDNFDFDARIKFVEDEMPEAFLRCMGPGVRKIKENILKELALIQEHELDLWKMDILDRGMLPAPDYSLSEYYPSLTEDARAALRNENMFYLMAILTDQYRGGVIFRVGAAHGPILIDAFKKWHSSRLIPIVLFDTRDNQGFSEFFLYKQQLLIQEGETQCLDMNDIGSEEGCKVEAAAELFINRLNGSSNLLEPDQNIMIFSELPNGPPFVAEELDDNKEKILGCTRKIKVEI